MLHGASNRLLDTVIRLYTLLISLKHSSLAQIVREAQRDISHYLMHRYNWIRPYQFNDGLPPAVAEGKLRPTVRDELTSTWRADLISGCLP